MHFSIKGRPVKIRIVSGYDSKGNKLEHSTVESLKKHFDLKDLTDALNDGRLENWLLLINKPNIAESIKRLKDQDNSNTLDWAERFTECFELKLKAIHSIHNEEILHAMSLSPHMEKYEFNEKALDVLYTSYYRINNETEIFRLSKYLCSRPSATESKLGIIQMINLAGKDFAKAKIFLNENISRLKALLSADQRFEYARKLCNKSEKMDKNNGYIIMINLAGEGFTKAQEFVKEHSFEILENVPDEIFSVYQKLCDSDQVDDKYFGYPMMVRMANNGSEDAQKYLINHKEETDKYCQNGLLITLKQTSGKNMLNAYEKGTHFNSDLEKILKIIKDQDYKSLSDKIINSNEDIKKHESWYHTLRFIYWLLVVYKDEYDYWYKYNRVTLASCKKCFACEIFYENITKKYKDLGFEQFHQHLTNVKLLENQDYEFYKHVNETEWPSFILEGNVETLIKFALYTYDKKFDK